MSYDIVLRLLCRPLSSARSENKGEKVPTSGSTSLTRASQHPVSTSNLLTVEPLILPHPGSLNYASFTSFSPCIPPIKSPKLASKQRASWQDNRASQHIDVYEKLHGFKSPFLDHPRTLKSIHLTRSKMSTSPAPLGTGKEIALTGGYSHTLHRGRHRLRNFLLPDGREVHIALSNQRSPMGISWSDFS